MSSLCDLLHFATIPLTDAAQEWVQYARRGEVSAMPSLAHVNTRQHPSAFSFASCAPYVAPGLTMRLVTSCRPLAGCLFQPGARLSFHSNTASADTTSVSFQFCPQTGPGGLSSQCFCGCSSLWPTSGGDSPDGAQRVGRRRRSCSRRCISGGAYQRGMSQRDSGMWNTTTL